MIQAFKSKALKILTAAALVGGAFALSAGSAQAQHHHHGGGHYHGGHYYHGGGYRGGVYLGFGAPYAYYPGSYYGGGCRWVRVRSWYHGYWHWRSVRRCY